MDKILKKLDRLRAVGAVHRKGFTLTQLSPRFVTDYLVSESVELSTAIRVGESRESVLGEMGDVLNCLLHLSIMLGVSQEELIAVALKKLDGRFKCP